MIKSRAILYLLFSILVGTGSGCSFLGLAASAIPQTVRAKYSGLAGQSVGIIVWTDRGIMIDWNSLQLDLANSVESKLRSVKSEETKGTTWPYPAASYVRWIRDHPGSDSWPITDIAPKLAITRLIYIEVHEFRTRSARELELFRGEATASMQIIEATPGESAIAAYSEDNIRAVYPQHAPADGLPNLGDSRTYIGEVDALATQIVNSLVTHEEERK